MARESAGGAAKATGVDRLLQHTTKSPEMQRLRNTRVQFPGGGSMTLSEIAETALGFWGGRGIATQAGNQIARRVARNRSAKAWKDLRKARDRLARKKDEDITDADLDEFNRALDAAGINSVEAAAPSASRELRRVMQRGLEKADEVMPGFSGNVAGAVEGTAPAAAGTAMTGFVRDRKRGSRQ